MAQLRSYLLDGISGKPEKPSTFKKYSDKTVVKKYLDMSSQATEQE